MSNPFFLNNGPILISKIIMTLDIKSEDINKNIRVTDIKDLSSSIVDDITFYHSKKYKDFANKTKASFCITSSVLKNDLPKNCKPLIVENVLLSTSLITSMFYPDALHDDFDDTVKNNISYANSNASQEEIEKACAYAAADQFIEKLPNKYETIVGENGVKLSGGQKQRISIARAILKKSPIILLDEATSSLDAESERVVQDAINNLIKGRTTLVIAHRLSTIHSADKIFVLKNGEIIGSGNHKELIGNNNEYKTLYKNQLK